MPLKTRPISWIKAALRDFQDFPEGARTEIARVLVIAAEGGKADIAKPMKGFSSGVFEIALKYRGDAFRAVYAVQIGDALWVVHAFQKKSKRGIETPRRDVELIRQRYAEARELENEFEKKKTN